MISVVIPTYKNKELLHKNLRKNEKFLKQLEVILVNDDPSDSIESEITEFKNVVLIENSENLGFGRSVNLGVEKSKNNLVMVLNNDVILLDDSFLKVQDEFKKNKKLFAISFAQKEKDGSIVGKNRVFWKKGQFFHSASDNLKRGFNAWAEGGSFIVDREKFIGLGGFDPIYYPFYWEDIDLSYRAWKNDYEIIFDPDILVEHHHESTIGKYFSKDYVKKIAFRNQFIFTWKNILDISMKINHLFYLIPNLLRFFIKGEVTFIIGFIKALCIKHKTRKNNSFISSDKQVLDLFNE